MNKKSNFYNFKTLTNRHPSGQAWQRMKGNITRWRRKKGFDAFTRLPLLSIFLLLAFSSSLFSQDYCENTFTDNEFSSIVKTEIQYGRAKAPPNNFNIDSVNLLMDLYYSEENTNTVQPIMFLLHGGTFIAELGDKSSMEEIARHMVSKGFVVVSVGYRTWSFLLGGAPTENDIVDIVVKAILDLQTSIDFVVEASGKGDFPEVDLQNMIIGGGSAGAITINHRLYIDAQDSLPEFLSDAFENNGGLFDGESDDYEIVYGLNMSGGIYDTAWIDAGEPPLISIHGDLDSVVYYNRGLAAGFIELYGSQPIDERLREKGIDSYFYTFKGGGHSNIYADEAVYRDPLLNVLDTGLMKIQNAICLTSNTSMAIVQANVKLVNTLVQYDLLVENNESTSMMYEIIDLWGRRVQSGKLARGDQQISFTASAPGYYAFRSFGKSGQEQTLYNKLFYYQGMQ